MAQYRYEEALKIVSQETTKDFSKRLAQAVAAHPLAPDNPYGSQAWLREKLKREAKIEVSPNAVHKWMNGTAKPRNDNIQKLARILNVDEIWLSIGVTPGGAAKRKVSATEAPSARGHVLVLAGLIEAAGGRVLFPGAGDPGDLRVNLNGAEMDLVVLAPNETNGKWNLVIQEPVGDCRIIAMKIKWSSENPEDSVGISLYDLTDLPRQTFGGYSLLEVSARPDGRLKAEGVKLLVQRLPTVCALADTV